ncbi:MAG: hypothetical protein H6706_25250 [Myxococcales bacterium]|nr:hypothetical protein [Myxococcales bacterium]
MLPALVALLLAAVPPMTGGIRINEPDDQRWAWFVEGAGLDTVQVTIYADQVHWDGADLEYSYLAWAGLPGLIAEVQAAQARGLQVMLVLRVKLDLFRAENRHLWHGMIWPRDEALEAWFARYRAFTLFWADWATRLGVDALVIGHELNSMTSTRPGDNLPDLLGYHLSPARTEAVVAARLACARAADVPTTLTTRDGHAYPSLAALLAAEDATHRGWAERVSGLRAPLAGTTLPPRPAALAARRARYAAFWRQLAADTRRVFPGPIGYGANFDQFEEVDFWDALDFIAISSYFPLRTLDTPAEGLDAALQAGWAQVIARIEGVARAVDRPVVLHELGWSQKLGSTIRPYSYHGVEPIEAGTAGAPRLACVHWPTQPDAPEERVRALDALVRAVEAGRFPSLRGVSFWKLTTEPHHRAEEPFAVVLPPPYVDRDADDDFVVLAARLAAAIRDQAPR